MKDILPNFKDIDCHGFSESAKYSQFCKFSLLVMADTWLQLSRFQDQ